MVLITGFTEPFQGLDAVKGFTAGMHDALSDFSLTIEDMIAEGDKVAVRATTRGTHTAPLPTPAGIIPPTGKQVSMSTISILRIADGKIAEERVQADVLGFMQQLGVIPAPGQG
jgi:predicted ester cyclase